MPNPNPGYNRKTAENAKIAEKDADIDVRFIKSELEEAWYQHDYAIESGGNAAPAAQKRAS